MFPGGPNPNQVQFVPPTKSLNPPLPLVLIHDGGGTTFSYFLLGSLDRDVWAIHNPKFFEGEAWEGGMDEMAAKYIDLLVDEGITGPIMLGGKLAFSISQLSSFFIVSTARQAQSEICTTRKMARPLTFAHLAGWSLGGFLSITMARMLAGDPEAKISVAGLLIIDSPRHIARSKITTKISKPSWTGIPALVQKSFENCDIMLKHWDLPAWECAVSGGKEAKFTVQGNEYAVGRSSVLHKPINGNWKPEEVRAYEVEKTNHDEQANRPDGVAGPPPAVLVRCTRPAKKAPDAGEEPCLVDLWRDELLLGWEGKYPDFIKAVIDVDTDHYSIFNREDLDKVSDRQ